MTVSFTVTQLSEVVHKLSRADACLQAYRKHLKAPPEVQFGWEDAMVTIAMNPSFIPPESELRDFFLCICLGAAYDSMLAYASAYERREKRLGDLREKRSVFMRLLKQVQW